MTMVEPARGAAAYAPDADMLISPRDAPSANENRADGCAEGGAGTQSALRMPFKATTSGLKTGFTPSTASQLSPHACRFGAAAPHATPAAAATPLATGASPEMMPGRANNYIPVSLGGPASAAADGGAPAGHHHTLLSTTPLVTQAFAIDAACNTADVTRRLGWDTATPERPRDGDMRAQDVSALFKRGAAAADAISPTVPFMAAMSKASIEDTLQFLVQSDLPTRPKSRPAPQAAPFGGLPGPDCVPRGLSNAQDLLGGPVPVAASGDIGAMLAAAPHAPCQYSASQQEYMYHISVAIGHLSEAEARRLGAALGAPSRQGCIDALSNVCEPCPSAAPPPAQAAPPPADEAAYEPFAQPLRGAVPALRLGALGPAAAPHCAFLPDPLSERPSGHSTATRPGSVQLSPRLPRAATLTPRGGFAADAAAAARSGAVTDRPAARPRKRTREVDMFYGSALLDQMQAEQRAARKRSAHAALAEGAATARIASPRRRKSGPPSSRDRVWELLRPEEKGQILADEMSAAEGTKLLLDRRAAQLGCSVVAMPEDDDWEIGFKLTECKATSEPLAVPKTCSICLRGSMVFHRHSYYCRRCAQLYRAIHRKKATLQAEGATQS